MALYSFTSCSLEYKMISSIFASGTGSTSAALNHLHTEQHKNLFFGQVWLIGAPGQHCKMLEGLTQGGQQMNKGHSPAEHS